ncbi:MAG TPA: MFS transporter [bacterium]|jgi:DHA2 family methylenomycin A resistance protein-like MFS transporter|nr:MFS transporter [bacterium]
MNYSTNPSTASAVSGLSPRARAKYGLYAICMGFFLVLVDTAALNVAMASMQREFGGNIGQLQWVVNSYTLVFASLMLACGAMGDRFGARLFYQMGLSLFTVMSLLCALSPGLGFLIGFRMLQGLGAALLLPASLSLLSHAFPNADEKAQAVAFWAAIVSLGFAAGPTLGGLLTHLFGWRSIFWLNVPLGLVTLQMVRVFVDEAKVENPRHIDWAGQAAACLMLFCLTYGLIEAGSLGWTAPLILGAFALSALFALAFWWFEKNSVSPVLPHYLFAHRIFSVCVSIGFILNFGMYGILFIVSIYLQNIRHLDPLMTGLMILPLTGFPTLTTRAIGRYSGRRFIKPRLIIGHLILLLGAGFLALALSIPGYGVVLLGLSLLGVGMGFVMPAMTAGVLTASEAETSGLASGILNSARQVGGTLGVALLGTWVSRLGEPGYLWSFVLAALLFGVMAWVTLWFIPEHI